MYSLKKFASNKVLKVLYIKNKILLKFQEEFCESKFK